MPFFRLFLSCFPVFLIGILFACQSPQAEENKITASGKETALLASYFEAALLQPALEDSLLQEARLAAGTDLLLRDAFRYHTIKNQILKGNLDMAERALLSFVKPEMAISKDYRLAKYYNLLASIAAYKSQMEDAIQYFKQALRLLETQGDIPQAAAVRFNLANIFLSRTDYQTAHKYTREAHEDLTAIRDTTYLPLVKGMLAVTRVHVQDSTLKDEPYAAQALILSRRYHNLQGEMLAYYALGEEALNKGEREMAIGYLRKAIDLGEAYGQPNFLLAGRAALVSSYLTLENYTLAEAEGLKALGLSERVGNTDISYSLRKNLSKVYAQLGQYDKAFAFMRDAEESYRAKSNRENQEVIQNLLIQYETEKKSKTILEQETRLQERKNWIILLAALAALSFASLIFIRILYRQKNRTLHTQRENAVLQALTEGEKKERERLSAELHDGIASQLFAIRLFLENESMPDNRHQALKMVKQAHREVRLAAHNLMPLDFSVMTLAQGIEGFCRQISTPQLPVDFFTNATATSLPRFTAHGLYRTVQELVQNALKHAQASHIYVQCLQSERSYSISIEDDGLGMDLNSVAVQKRISYLTNRLQQLDAQFDFEASPGRGTLITIKLTITTPTNGYPISRRPSLNH